MRVLFSSQEYPPETGWGGIGTYLGIIAPALVRMGVEVHVLSVVEGQAHSDTLREGVHLHRRPLVRPRGVGRLTRLPEVWDRLSTAAGVRREIAVLVRSLGGNDPAEVFDVVEVPEWKAEGLLVPSSVPLVVRLHSAASQVFPFRGRMGRDERGAIALEERAIRRAKVVTGTTSQQRTLGRQLQLPADRTRDITYPVVPRDRLPWADDRPRIVFAGRFQPRKGVDVLVRSLRSVVEAVPDAELVLVGKDTREAPGGSMADHLRAIARADGVEGSLTIVERWGADAVEEWYGRATVVAVPSRWESFGYTAAEAAAFGRPVVASDLAPLREIVEDGVTGVLAPVEGAPALAAALISLLRDPGHAREMGARASSRIRERCHPDAVAQRTLEAYHSAIGTRHGVGAR